MSVLYPGETPFSPDVIAILDVEQPEDDERLAWVVADEGKGPDLIIEVLHRGNRNKNLVENVERYARLGIAEYFVYDRLRQQIHGYRLSHPGVARYQRIVKQLGHYRSSVLGLELTILNQNLRFLSGEATLPVSADLIGRLQGMMESLETKALAAQEEAAAAQEQAERARAQNQEAVAAGLREGLLAILDARGIACQEDARQRVDSCVDATTLRQWLLRAKTATRIDDMFSRRASPDR
jgi:hypothetical protein